MGERRALVLAMIGSANRDPQQSRDPGRFDITRDPNTHIAFGDGVHFCLGAPLSRLKARIALADLLERLKGSALASAEPWEPRKAFHVHGPARLPIRFEPAGAAPLRPDLGVRQLHPAPRAWAFVPGALRSYTLTELGEDRQLA
jgi:hypothetical protein